MNAYVILGETDYSPGDVLGVILDPAIACALKQAWDEYDKTKPPMRFVPSREEWAQFDKWLGNHPATKFSNGTTYDSYAIVEAVIVDHQITPGTISCKTA